MLTPAADTRAADWIVASLTTFGKDVNSLVPAGFETYVRVFHPAWSDDCTPVTWTAVAAPNGAIAHAGMQFNSLLLKDEAPYRREPSIGTLDDRPARQLCTILRGHTATPDRCWFAAWEGMGALRDDVAAAPKFHVPNRAYHLLEDAIDGALESIGREPWDWSSHIWWPDDHAWCVATEIDLNTTYVGCSRACCDELVACPEIEALEIDPSTGISYLSDELNPAPPR